MIGLIYTLLYGQNFGVDTEPEILSAILFDYIITEGPHQPRKPSILGTRNSNSTVTPLHFKLDESDESIPAIKAHRHKLMNSRTVRNEVATENTAYR